MDADGRRFGAWIWLAVTLSACDPAPPPTAAPVKVDVTKEAWYGDTTARLAALNKEVETALAQQDRKEAAARITEGQPLAERLLSASNPTLAAMESASDLDDLYGRMLVGDHKYGWARMVFQKNVVRWSHWKPATDESLRRRKEAEKAVAECDRRMSQQ